MSVFYPLYYRIYRLNLGMVFLMMGIAILLWAFFAAKIGNKHQNVWKVLNVVLFLFLLFAIIYYTVLRRSPDPCRQIILTPFASLQAAKHQSEIYRALTMNILLFFPVGMFVSQLFHNRHRMIYRVLFTVVIGLLLSLTIESLQFFLLRGDVETDDLITNMVGTFIGALSLPCTALFKEIDAKQ